ncbi:hypothetical protein Tsp_14606, partial [Trichinella spiralis]|uniref:hypothetical protein n=1 Tax=Trichinella spiralis TaxID=6334 RepID=UPI0001EFDD1A
AASETRKVHTPKSASSCVRQQCGVKGSLDWGFRAGAGPITNDVLCMVSRLLIESGCLRLQPKAGGKSHPRLNIRTRPIANKYREGKESSTGRETVDRQTDGADGAILTKISRRW